MIEAENKYKNEPKRIEAALKCIKEINKEKELFNHSRKRSVLIKRQAIQHWLSIHTSFTLSEIGELTGGKKAFDHSNMCNSIASIQKIIKEKDAKKLPLCYEVWVKLMKYERRNKRRINQ